MTPDEILSHEPRVLSLTQREPRPCQVPPDWSGGYTSIFAAQAGEG